jgi:hypothetical protein
MPGYNAAATRRGGALVTALPSCCLHCVGFHGRRGTGGLKFVIPVTQAFDDMPKRGTQVFVGDTFVCVQSETQLNACGTL